MKRKAESIVGVVTVDSEETTLRRVFRLDRAINEIGPRFNLTICKCDASGKLIGSFNATLTITAIVYQEPLRSRWARALDTIREEYGLSIEWEETEITERPRPTDTYTTSGVSWDRSDQDADIMGDIQRGYEAIKNMPFQPEVRIFNSEKSLAELVFNNDLDEVDHPPKTEEVHRGKSGDLSVLVGGEKVSVRVREGDTYQEMGERLNAAIQAHCADRGIESKYAPSVELSAKPPEPETKTYADTPTGTVEFDVDVGHLRSSRVNWSGEDTTPFKYALHLKQTRHGLEVLCPCCGNKIDGLTDGDSDSYFILWRNSSYSRVCLCGIRSTYDFDKEIVTMVRV